MARPLHTDYPFGKWLIQEMMWAGKDVKSIAPVMDISTKTIYKHIRGSSVPSPSEVCLYCYIFGKEHSYYDVMKLCDQLTCAKKITEFRKEVITERKTPNVLSC